MMPQPPWGPEPAPTSSDLNRSLQEVAAEYRSFLAGFASLLDGVERWRAEAQPDEAARWDLLRRQANSLLIQHGVRPTAHVGRPVDLEQHEVLGAEPSTEAAPDTILRIVQTGLELNILGQRVPVRPARVVIAAPCEPAPNQPEPKE